MQSTARTISTIAFTALLICVPTSRSAADPPAELPLLDLRFGGGTAADYVAAVAAAAGQINVVVPAEAGEVAMPPIALKHVTPAAALDLLDGKSMERPGRRVRLSITHMPVYRTDERQTFQVEADVRGQPGPPTMARVWAMAELLDHGVSSDAVLAAVETALDVAGSSSPLDVRFHEDTALLIASGDGTQLEAIEMVIDRLRESTEQRGDEARNNLEREMEKVQEDRARAAARIEELEVDLARVRKEVEAQRIEMTRLEVHNEELRRMLDGRERELAKSNAEVRSLEQALMHERLGRDTDPEAR